MKIAVNCSFFLPHGGGIKEYIHNLVDNLSLLDKENEYVLYVLEEHLDYARTHLKTGFRIKTIPFRSDGLLNKVRRSLSEHSFWRREEKLEKWDIFHSPFFHAPKLRRAKVVMTVHDLRLCRYPHTYSLPRYLFLRSAVRRSVLSADRIISISNFTADEIVDCYGVPRSKVTVIHEAINGSHFSPLPLSDADEKTLAPLRGVKFILSVGHLEPRKNYDRLVRAFSRMRKEGDDVRLVIVGKKNHGFRDTLALIESTPGVMYLDFVSQPVLNWLYLNTSLFVFPSIYEGFGFPPLEAATCGVISAVSNVSSIPEVCGDAAVYFDPLDVEDMAAKMSLALYDAPTRDAIRARLQPQLDSFSWSRNAEETIKVYKSVTDK